ncbi:GH15674 [Drosophila grimshawi]|uniref:GH15674 n=1 Tax=Drosophila grimshawi TaxID=7222 RepID=B4IZP8_DROGR|nr:GH15674 [Drosophila grimshawi]
MCTNNPAKTRARKRGCHHANLIAIGYFIVLLALIEPVLVEGDGDLLGHGTTHEQLGQRHFPPVDLTPYSSTVHYSADRNRSSWAITPVFNFTHCLFDAFVSSNSALPPGYLSVKNGDTLALGPKVEKNDWSALLAHYWLALVWVFFLVLLIFLMPFIGVCYCCFCCCRRCKKGCPPCQAKEDSCRNMVCSMLLLLLILFMLLGAIIAFTSNRTLDRGLDDTRVTVRRGTEDTCRFLKDVSDHIHHIFIHNYEELEAHINDMLTNAHLHIFLDLADVSEANAIEQLERIMDNMKEATVLMRRVDKLEKDLRFYGTQLRDGVRGAKRDVNYACANLISHEKCQSFLRNSAMEFVDASPCLHLDKMPNTTVFVDGMRSIILEMQNVEIPKKALQRFQEIGVKIHTVLQQVIPPLVRDVTKGRKEFETRSGQIRTLIDKVISDIHMRTLRSTQSFEDVYEKFGSGRSYVNAFASILIITVAIIVIVALICSCCGRLAVGATCLLIQFHCPICMGAPIVPDLVPGQGNRFLAGRNDGDFIILTDQLESESNVLEVKESQTSNNKRKQE